MGLTWLEQQTDSDSRELMLLKQLGDRAAKQRQSYLRQKTSVYAKKRGKFLSDTSTSNALNLKNQLIPLNFLTLTLMTIWTQRTSIMKTTSFAVSKEKRNWDSNVLCGSSGPILPALAGTKSNPMEMGFL
ncbi:hypothetical protein AVEN_127773-1 [Araneus ventricosus]|uniref:Uncharacterized protein n=1 Tax=Araneus ventricosus TaxID=182803 RepID=A0A4Y2MAU1_ARAVE|nr:hypothetical protein AVEN_127773-1 [Araneus ventricosus]